MPEGAGRGRRGPEGAGGGRRGPEGAGGGRRGPEGAGGDRIGLGVLEVLRRGKKQYKIELIALSIYF